MTSDKKEDCKFFQDGKCTKDDIDCFLMSDQFKFCIDFEEKKKEKKR